MAINVQFAKGISIPTTSNLVTGGLYFNTSNKNIYFNNEGTIVTFQGTDTTTATKLGSTTIGSASKPIYLSSGTATECSTYAGGTAVTLNGSSKSASTASFYAPTSAGTSSYILQSNGTGAPTWVQTLPIANGGTGATTAADARANLRTVTMYIHDDISTTVPAFPSESAWGATFSSNSVVNTTEKNDNYMLHVSSLGNLYTGYQINSMTTPTWTKVCVDGHATHPSISWDNKVFKVLNSKGWYRVYQGANINVEGDTVLINISSHYTYSRTITLSFVITLGYQNDANIKLLSCTGQDDSCISNIRVVKDNTTYGKSYIDIYFNKTDPEDIYVTGIGQGTFQAPEAAPPLTNSQDVIELEISNHHTLGSNTGYVLTTTSGTVGISQGGTGATTADAALKNLGAAAASHTPILSDDSSDFPAGYGYGAIFSRNPITKNTANNDNYMIYMSDRGTLYVGYQLNQMTTPTWNEVSLVGHDHDNRYAKLAHTHKQANLVSWLGLGTLNTSSTWGTLTSSNGYTIRLGTDQTDGGGLVIAEKDGRTSLQVDGEIYVSEGVKKVMTAQNFTLSGTTLTITTT